MLEATLRIVATVSTGVLSLCLAGCQSSDSRTVTEPKPPAQAALASQTCQITQVSDGDSVQARCPGQTSTVRIRLKGIDAPELRQSYGATASQALVDFCMKQIVTPPAQLELDRYGRALVALQCQNQDVGQRLVTAGLAWVYRGASDYPQLLEAEQRAKRNGLDL